MKQVRRDEVMGLADYESIREQFRARVIAEKKARRVHVGDHVTATFENHDTVLMQIQEMLRTERITREPAIAHEIETYNQLVPNRDELSATVMIEFTENAERDAFLIEARGFERHVALVVDGIDCRASWDPARELEDRTSAVHYLKFPLTPAAAKHLREKRKDARVELIVDHDAYREKTTLSPATLASLAEDLEADG